MLYNFFKIKFHDESHLKLNDLRNKAWILYLSVNFLYRGSIGQPISNTHLTTMCIARSPIKYLLASDKNQILNFIV